MSEPTSELGLSGILENYDHEQLYDISKPLIDYLVNSEETVLINTPDIVEQTVYVDNKPPQNHLPAIEYSLPPQIPQVLSNEEYPGPLNFDVLLVPYGTKNPWVFSSVLKKIFINMNVAFPVDFKWDLKANEDLFIRATPIFALPQYSQDLVTRCFNHAQKRETTNAGQPPHVWPHVIRCQNSQAIYCGDADRGIHLNVLVPLSNPQTGTETVREMYQFMCKNSCPSGMNRKPIEVLFTLENRCEILGRRVLQVRVCSCPKRDKEKEENEFTKKGDSKDAPHGKKRKLEKPEKKTSSTTDTAEYSVNLKIIGKHNYISVLENCYNTMAGEIVKRGSPGDQPYRKCLHEINNLLKAAKEQS